MRAQEFVAEITISRPDSRVKSYIDRVYAKYPQTWQNNHVMPLGGTGNDQQFVLFELAPNPGKKNTAEIKWFQAYPLRQGVGSRAMKILQDLAAEYGISLTLFPWNKGQVSQAKLIKFYRQQGFRPAQKGSKNLVWEPRQGVAEDTDNRSLPSVDVAKQAMPRILVAAQRVYNDWDESDKDTYAGGGICHIIADAICDVLGDLGVDSSPVSCNYEQHVYVAGRFEEGIYTIDIPYHIYETGGGFSWKKVPAVTFEPRDVVFYRVSGDPDDFEQYISESVNNFYPEDLIQGVAEAQTAKAGIVQTDVYGTRAYHAKCMEPGCDWQSRRYDRIQQAQTAAKKHGEQHFKEKQGVAEDAELYPEVLYHGSTQEIKGPLTPRQAKDIGGHPGSNKNAIYATDDPNFAIAYSLAERGSDTGTFGWKKEPRLIFFGGKIRHGENVYIHVLPTKDDQGRPLFARGGADAEWYSLPEVKEIMPIKVITKPVDQYLHLLRKPTPEEQNIFQTNKAKAKQGVAEGNIGEMAAAGNFGNRMWYHGTNKRALRKILETGVVKPFISDSNIVGEAIYLSSDINEALTYGKIVLAIPNNVARNFKLERFSSYPHGYRKKYDIKKDPSETYHMVIKAEVPLKYWRLVDLKTGNLVKISKSMTKHGVAEGYSNTTFQTERRRLNVPALIKAGALFVTYPHGEQGWELDNKEDWAYSLISLYNVMQGGWAGEAKKYLKPASYKKAEQQINSSAPNLGSNQLVYDGKYNQILWSIKKLGIPDNVAFLDKGRQGVAEDTGDKNTQWLYHATYRPLLKSIKAHGLGGDRAQAKWEDSKPGVVYLALDPNVAESYAESSNVVPEDWLDQIVILKIAASKLDKSRLFVDQNVQDNEGDTLEYHGVIPLSNISLYKKGVAEDIDYQRHLKLINAHMKKMGYRRLGGGRDAQVYAKQEGSIIKILIPQDGKTVGSAEIPFLEFYKYCRANQKNPHLPKFGQIQGQDYADFHLDGERFVQIAQERLSDIPAPSEYDDMLFDMINSVENNTPLEQKYQGYELFYKTLKSVAQRGRELGFENDFIKSDDDFNIMLRGKTLVITDPWLDASLNESVAEVVGSQRIIK